MKLLNSAGGAAATAYVYGAGQGPAVGFLPATQTTVGTGMSLPWGVAVDAAGNVYASVNTSGSIQVVKIAPNGVETNIGPSTNSVLGLAVDGVGNVYYANYSGGIVVIPAGCNSTTCATSSISGSSGNGTDNVAVDGAGDVFINEYGDNRVVEVTPSGFQTTVPTTGLNGPEAVAVDSAGDLFIADNTKNRVVEVTPAGIQTTVPVSGLSGPTGVAVDAAGDVYITDGGNRRVVEVTPTGVQTTLVSGLNGPFQVATDGAGNVYIADSNNSRIVKLGRSSGSLSYATTAVGATSTDSPQSVTVQNIGNQPLDAVSPGLAFSAPNFVQVAGSGTPQDCSDTFALAPAGTCNISISFEPEVAGLISNTLTLDDNALNNSSALQSIALQGTATKGSQTITFNTNPPASAAYNSMFTVAASASSGLAVTYTSSGVCTNVSATYTMTASSGTCTVIVNQAGNANYLVAPQVTKSVSATKATQSISYPVNAPFRAVYNSSFTWTATASSGLPVTYSSSGACTNSGSLYTMTSGTGTCTVIANQAGNANYAAAPQVSQSETVATLAPQTIAFTTNAPASAVYNTGFTVSASASSGLAVAYTSSGVCTNVGATYTMTAGSGTCTVIVNQGGNSNYLAAPQVTQSVNATKATQSITFNTNAPASAAYNSMFTVAASSSSGLAVAYANSGVCTNVGGTYTMTAGSGTCTVIVNQAGNSNYLAAPQVTMSVNAALASQSITFTGFPAMATYGAAGPYTLNGTASSSLAVTYGVTGPASLSNSTLTITGAGLVSVTASQTGNANYGVATPVTQTIQVNPATPIVTWPTASAITYGQPLGSSMFSGGSASVPGNFVWTTPAAILIAGSQSASVTFIPSDSADYSSLTSTVSLTVNPANYVVTVSSDDAGTASNCTPQATPGIGTDASCSLRDALLQAAATGGGNISFASSGASYLTLTSPLPMLTGQIVIAGPGGASLTQIDGNLSGSIFQIGSGATVTFSGVEIERGNDGGTGGGAGILNNGGTLTIMNCYFLNNTATSANGGGAILNNGGALVISGSTFWGNQATSGDGGAINSIGGALSVSYSTFYGNFAGGNGGAIVVSGNSTGTVTNATFQINSANGNGGAIEGNSTLLTVSSSIFQTNQAADGAAMQAGTGSISASNNLFYLNSDLSGTAVDCGNCTLNANPVSGNPNLSPIGGSGGLTPTQTPVPPSAAICAGPPVAAGTDQRGLPNSTTYNGTACYDLGAVQSNYAQSITAEPPSTGTVSGVAMSPAPAVTVTESGTPTFAPVSITATDAASDLATTPATATAAAGIASFSNLVFASATTADTLTTTLILNPANPAINLMMQSTSFSVGAATPTVTWPTASAITYGQTLASSTLSGGSAVSGSTSVLGSFGFTNPSSAPGAGTQSESVTFSPADSTAYNSVTTNISVQVNKATPSVTWPTASAIAYGQTLTSSTLSGGSSVSGNTPVPGTFAFTTPSTAPSAGTQSESVTFTPNDSTDYASATSTVSVLVNKATLTVTWPTASAITYGQPLSSSTLSGGSASVAGTFTFTNPATVPTAGTQSVSVTFTPADTTDYNSVTSSSAVSVQVYVATTTITLSNLVQTYTGDPISVTATVSPSYCGPASVTYNNSSTAPMAIGTYTVLASIGNPNCIGPSVTGTLIINAFAAADCLYTLDPSAAKSFSVSGNSAITAQCNLQINSSNKDAFDVSGNASVTATAISVVGGASINGHPTVSVTPLTSQAALADPLAAVQAPTVGACTYTNWHNASTTLSPGTYCGGITVSGKTTVNFNPGTYVLLGGGLNISGGAEASGSGVTFYNTGNSTYAYKPVSITGGSITSLAAPRSGPMAGVLFFQDRAIVSNAQNTVSGGSGTVFEGALYFPTTPLAYSGSSSATHATYNLIVADTFTLSGGGSGYLTTLGN